MPIFKADPAKKLANDLVAARANRDKLIERLAVAEALIPERRATAKDLARDGADDAALDRAEDQLRKAQDRVATLSAALDETSQQIAALEKEQAERAEQKQRAETSSDLEKRRERFLLGHEALDKVLAEFVEATAAVAEVCIDAQGLLIFSKSARDELHPAVAMVSREMSARVAATLDGRAPASLPKAPPQLVPSPAPAPPPIASYYTLQPAKFVDAQGQQRRVPRYMVIELTERQAANALRAGVVCKLDDPRVQQLRRQAATQQPPEAWNCFDLDSNTPPTNDPQLMARHSSSGSGNVVFTPIDRGPPRTMSVPKGDVADKVAATRSAAVEPMRSIIRYMPPGPNDHDHIESRSSPLAAADGQRACYSGPPNIPGLDEYFERRRAHSRRIADLRKRMQARHAAFGL